MKNPELKALLSDLIIDEDLIDILDTLGEVAIEKGVNTLECVEEDDYESKYYREYAKVLDSIGKRLKELSKWGDKRI